jgi:hypothetical protein
LHLSLLSTLYNRLQHKAIRLAQIQLIPLVQAVLLVQEVAAVHQEVHLAEALLQVAAISFSTTIFIFYLFSLNPIIVVDYDTTNVSMITLVLSKDHIIAKKGAETLPKASILL